MSRHIKFAIIACLLQAAIIYWYKSSMSTLSSPAVKVIASAEPVKAAQEIPAVPRSGVSKAPEVVGVEAKYSNRGKSREIEDLIKTGHPGDAMKAYEAISLCAKQRNEISQRKNSDPADSEDEKEFGKPADLCGDITAQQLANRIQYLEYAAAANVRNAAVRLLDEGPPDVGKPDVNRIDEVWSGNGHEQWKKNVIGYLLAAGERGDVAALANLSRLADYPSSKIDHESAVKYGSAALAIIKSGSAYHSANPDAFAKLEIMMKQRMEGYGKNLTKDQLFSSMEAGKKMALDRSQ